MFKSKEERQAERQSKEAVKARKSTLVRGIKEQAARLGKLQREYRANVELHRQEMSTKWQYVELYDLSVEAMNKAGEQGWELVSVASYSTNDQAFSNVKTVHLTYIFKRQIPEETQELEQQSGEVTAVSLGIMKLRDELETLLGKEIKLEDVVSGYWD